MWTESWTAERQNEILSDGLIEISGRHTDQIQINALTRAVKDGMKAAVMSLSPGAARHWRWRTGEERIGKERHTGEEMCGVLNSA